jgi:hypothetical protein
MDAPCILEDLRVAEEAGMVFPEAVVEEWR